MGAIDHVMQNGEFYVTPAFKKSKSEHIAYRDSFVDKMRLTKREAEMIGLICQGKHAQEIADQLFLSLHTVNTHRKNILKKLNLNSLADLVRFAFENHLIEKHS